MAGAGGVPAPFATVELKTLLAQLLRRTELRLIPQRMRPTSVASMRPRNGVRVEVVRRCPQVERAHTQKG